MAAITFTISSITGKTAKGTLRWVAKNLTANAISGGFGKGYLPAGTYKAARSKLLDKPAASSYCDTSGNCWMQAIDPTFTTDRTELGIHPDGGTEGTEGCIGLKTANTKAWYDAFKAMGAGGSTDIEVIDATVAATPLIA